MLQPIMIPVKDCFYMNVQSIDEKMLPSRTTWNTHGRG